MPAAASLRAPAGLVVLDATAWTVIGAGVAILAAIGAAFRSMRAETPRERTLGSA